MPTKKEERNHDTVLAEIDNHQEAILKLKEELKKYPVEEQKFATLEQVNSSARDERMKRFKDKAQQSKPVKKAAIKLAGE